MNMESNPDKNAANDMQLSGPVSPPTPAHLLDAGWQAYAQHDLAKAESSFQEALRLDPDCIDAIFGLGLTLKAAGQKEAAVGWFRKAAEVAEYIENRVRGRMIHRLAVGHIHDIETGDWNLEKETWQKQG